MTRPELLRRRSRREWLVAVLVPAGLTGFVVVVYVAVVLGGGALLGRTSTPDVALSILATAVVALSFDRVQSSLHDHVMRSAHRGGVSPYDVLRQFSETVAGTYATEELPARMARLLADGTGARWAQVWLVVADRPTLVATWPRRAGPTDDAGSAPGVPTPGRRSWEVRHDDALLGVLVVQERDQVPLTDAEQRLVTGLASQAQLVLRGAQLHAELAQRAAQLTIRAEELRASRERLVDAQDASRRRLERDIHDGAQQHLVALAVNLRLAQTLAVNAPDRADAVLAEQERAVRVAIATLAELSRGIYPRSLADGGLAAALAAHLDTWPGGPRLQAVTVGRHPRAVETAAYFSCLEAVQNAVKHARATHITVELLGGDDGSLSYVVDDDGRGFVPRVVPQAGGLGNMRDRIEAVGGTLTITRPPAGGTRVRAVFPARPVAAREIR